MNKLIPIEYQGQRILTTEQLAEAYGTDNKHISENFNNNSLRYVVGKHCFRLAGEGLIKFKEGYPKIPDTLKFTSILYLWTEKGAWLHAKSLNTDKAWEAYEALVDDYYAIKQPPPMLPQSIEDLIIMQAQSMKEFRLTQQQQATAIADHEFKLATIDQKVTNEITLTTREQKHIQSAVNSRAHNMGLPDMYRQIYSALKKHFGVPSYRDLKRSDLTKAFEFIRCWSPRIQ